MTDRIVLAAAIAFLLVCLSGAGSASASVKCQCNNGAITEDMSSDPDDDDLDSACNDACSELGGGKLWSPESDGDGDDDGSVRPAERRPVRAAPRR